MSTILVDIVLELLNDLGHSIIRIDVLILEPLTESFKATPAGEHWSLGRFLHISMQLKVTRYLRNFDVAEVHHENRTEKVMIMHPH